MSSFVVAQGEGTAGRGQGGVGGVAAVVRS